MQACLPTVSILKIEKLHICIKITCLDYIHPDIVADCVKLLLQERRQGVVNVLHALCVLSSKGGSSSHRIAPMCSDDLLVRFKTTANILSVAIGSVEGRGQDAYAPPELSDPAITKILFTVAMEKQAQGDRLKFRVWFVKDLMYRAVPFRAPLSETRRDPRHGSHFRTLQP